MSAALGNSSNLLENKSDVIDYPLIISSSSGISDDVLTVLDTVFNCVLIHCLCLFGIVGNIINVTVLSYQGLKESNIMLFSLSIIDMLGSLFRQVRRLKCIVATLDIPSSITIDTFGSVVFILMDNWCLALSFFHITAIAVERCWAVCAPFSVSSVFTPRRVKILLAFLYVYTAVILSPLFYRLTLVWDTDSSSNATVARVAYTRFYRDNLEAVNLFSTIFYNNICTTAPLLTILICSLVIASKLMQERPRELAKLSSERSIVKRIKDRKVVKMLLTVCMATVVSCLPTAILSMYMVYSRTALFTGRLYYVLRSVSDVLYQFSASVNFIIYVSLSTKFNKVYQQIFLSCFRSSKNYESDI
uniref:G-protein coupled receptors family 1 profile domain-containing protein n=1 Tax=Biomphalaria glabrata TaxID=6526 RepID=A0A2C9LC59_BIOGL